MLSVLFCAILALPLRALQTTPVEIAQSELKQLEAEEQKLPPAVAIQRFQELASRFANLNEEQGQGRAELALTRLSATAKQLDKAEGYGRAAVGHLSQSKDSKLEATAHFALAGILMQQAKTSEALDQYQKAASSFHAAKEDVQEGRSLNGMGSAYAEMGFLDRAYEQYFAAYTLANAIQSKLLLGRSLNNLGGNAEATNRFAEALQYYNESLQIKIDSEDKPGQAHVYSGLCTVYLRLGEYSKALDNCIKASDIFEAEKSDDTALVLNNIGLIYKNTEDYEKSADFLNRSYQAAKAAQNERDMLPALNNLGYLLSIEDKHEQSLEKHREALKIASSSMDLESQIHAQHGIANNYFRMGKLTDAQAAFKEVIVLSERLKAPDEIAGGHNGLGRAYESAKQPSRALAEYKAAVEVIENVRSQVKMDTDKAEYLANNLEAYVNVVRLLTGPGRDTSPASAAEAFSYTERWRGRALLELLAEGRSRVTPRVDAKVAEELESLQAQIYVLQGEIRENKDSSKEKGLWDKSDRLLDAFARTQAKIKAQDPNYASLQAPQTVALREIQRVLPEDTVLLEYAFDHQKNLMGLPRQPWGICFAISKREYLVFPIASAEEIPDLIDDFRDVLMHPLRDSAARNEPPTAFARVTSQLYRRLVAPADSLLRGKRHLIVVPDRSLTLLPFETLLTSDASASRWGDLPYLLRTYTVSYIPSATVYAHIIGERPSYSSLSKDLLALANPVYEESLQKEGLLPLPYTEEEAKAVSQLFPQSRREVLLGADANPDKFREAVQKSQFAYLLLSVHSAINVRYPQFSSLVLSKSPGSPSGMLQVYEIYNLRLPSKMVVLSACKTALGKNIQGEGLLGLTRAFLYAGSGSVVASLWNVEDQSTSLFMARFFGNVKRGQGPLSESLQQAKLQMLGNPDYAHPFFWAAFTLSGTP